MADRRTLLNELVEAEPGLYSRDPAVRKEAAKTILSAAEMVGPTRLIVHTPMGEKDIRSMAAEELKRSGDLSDVETLTKAYVLAVEDGMHNPGEMVRFYAGYVQTDVMGALFAVLKRCDTLEKVGEFERRMGEGIAGCDGNAVCFLREIREAAQFVKGQIEHDVMSKPTPKKPPAGRPKARKRLLTR